jgi:hypothetical protein
MAVCHRCCREMPSTHACIVGEYVGPDGTVLPAVPFGRETGAMRYVEAEGRPTCGDCASILGQAHHEGCDVEQCPACRGQRISCGCPLEWRAAPDSVESATVIRVAFRRP